MSPTPLEDQVHDALHRTAAPLHRAPLTVTDVRTRARRIRRRRAAAAGAAVAAVLAVAVPVGVGMVNPAPRSDVPPATQPPAPAVTGTVRIDPRSAEVVDSTPVPLVDVDGPSLITSDGTLTLPEVFDTLTPYRDGWVGVTMDEGRGTLEFLTADLEVEDRGGPTGGLVVSPDGTRVAWSEYTGSRWEVAMAEVGGGVEWTYLRFPPGPEDQRVEPVGFVSEVEVVVRQNDGTGRVTDFVADGDTPVELPGLMQAEAASPATGAVAGVTRSTVEGSCSAVVDGRAGNGRVMWDTCDYTLTSFSPDGRHLVGLVASGGEYGSPTLAVLDAATGEPVVDFEVAAGRRQIVGIDDRIAWADDGTLVVRVMHGEDYYVVQLGLDGTVQRVGIASAGASGLSVAEVR
ncbi:TolB-like translocation protein [Nocardioides xinjiangensis]|uniref:hypothetical protein n=1 Tax=Nocardioides xinjiangensis TaxID=2817376 RepID=UPI001B30B1AA|nr:hypothetical protein [Nocardioides sp. SYSU D00778]